jgi:hypothetical protein
VFESCSDGIQLTQVLCEADRGVWDPTVVSAIPGHTIILNGDGIDPLWTITVGGVVQETGALNLPTQVNFTLADSTPLGAQELIITNTDGDTATMATTFMVTDHLRIITVTDEGSGIFSITGANFWPSPNTAITLEVTGIPGVTAGAYTPTFIDANNISFDATGQASGTYDVILTHTDGQSFREVSCITIP